MQGLRVSSEGAVTVFCHSIEQSCVRSSDITQWGIVVIYHWLVCRLWVFEDSLKKL